MENNLEKDVISKIVDNVIQTKFENFDEPTLENAKDRIIDVMGCLMGGAGDSGNREFVNLIQDIGGKPESTIMIYGHKVPVQNAAMVNSILARSFDFEPVSPYIEKVNFPGHISGSTVMTALSLGEITNANGNELITALLLGDDLATRVLHSAGFEFSKGWDNIGTVNGFGTTAIAGRMLGLDKTQFINAFGIILNQLSGSMQIVWDMTTAFKICQGLSSRNGIFSAKLAQINWSAPEDPLFGRFGYYKLYTEGCKAPEVLTKDLGKQFYSDKTIKPYPCCRIVHAAIDSALAVVNKNNIQIDNIKEIKLGVSKVIQDHSVARPFSIGRFPHANAAFSICYVVATAILNQSVKPQHFTEEVIRSPKVAEIINKIELIDSNEGGSESARVIVKMKDGQEHTEFTEIAKGDPQNPLSRDELLAKYWNNVEFGGMVSKDNAAKILSMIENIENLDSVKDLVNLTV